MNGKKMVLRALAFALCLLLVLPAAAASNRNLSTQEKAEALYALGLFQGKGTLEDGSPDFALADEATRNEAATMLIRLLGQEAKAKAQYQAGALECPFSDVPNWAKGNVTWLYENSYVNGATADTYNGAGTITAQQFVALLLRSLGYSETLGDFSYSGALDFAREKGLLDAAQSSRYSQSFVRGDMVELCYTTLYLPMRDSGRTLYQQLELQGVFSRREADTIPAASELTLQLKYSGGGRESRWYVQEATVSAPILTDLDRDGSQELLFTARSIFCLDPVTGESKWNIYSGMDRSTEWTGSGSQDYGRCGVSMQVCDLEGDGRLELVTVHTNYSKSTSCIAVYDDQGYFKAGWPRYTEKPVYSLEICDFEGDGNLEICIALGTGSNDIPALYIFEHDGSIRRGWPQYSFYGTFSNSMASADLDGDGSKELILLYDEQFISAYHSDGSTVACTAGAYRGLDWNGIPVCEDYYHELECLDWAFQHGGFAYATGDRLLGDTREGRNVIMGTRGGIAVSDLDGDGSEELVFTAMVVDGSIVMRGDTNSFTDCIRYFTTFILNKDRTRYVNEELGFDWTQMPRDVGTVLTVDTKLIPYADNRPVISDLDGDGYQEILYSANDGMVHCFRLDQTAPGAWPYDLNARGESVISFATRPVAADLNGDGKQEVIFATYTQQDQKTRRGSLYVLDHSGQLLCRETLPITWGSEIDYLYANGAMAEPCVADLDGDGKYEIAVTTLFAGVVVYDVD